jgi:hypothetical protein
MAATFRMDVAIEAKDDETAEGVQPHMPDPLSAAVAVQDTMADVSKHGAGFGWRITRVRPVTAGTVVVSAADLRHVLNWISRSVTLPGPEAGCAIALAESLDAS